MLRIVGPGQSACDGVRRRELLRLGGLSALGLSLPSLLADQPAAAASLPGFGRAKSCLLIYLFGGPSQIDLWDMKPTAPERFRGEFRPIETSTPGITICEHLPRLARQSDKYCLLRSMHHEHPRHGWGLYYMFTGRKHNRPDLDAPPTPDDFPGIGALVNRLGKASDEDGPAAITLPRWNRFNDVPNDYAGEKAGFLGPAFDPWLVRASSADGQSFEVPSLELPPELSFGRLVERRDLLGLLDRRLGALGESGRARESLINQAYALLGSPRARRAFALDEEAPSVRDRYGRHPFGQGLLLARRLIEAGTRLVQVNWHDDGSDVKSPFWDTHRDIFPSLEDKLLPPFDEGFAALLDDMDARGLLDETLVLVTGEFGRTPRVGQVIMNAATNSNGRDHWPHAYTVLAAGAGVEGGSVYGATDNRAAFVIDKPVSPPDLHATVLHLLGIDPGSPITDRRGRTQRASLGTPVLGLF